LERSKENQAEISFVCRPQIDKNINGSLRLEIYNPGWYINHSCNPNSDIKDSIKILAMKNIMRSEEVTIDYSTFESEKGWYLECQCKNKNCRHIIRSYEFLPPKLKQKYRDFISEFLK
jgi:uncharacterized protein